MATEFERKRLENIRCNDEMMAALNVRAKAASLREEESKKKKEKKREKQSKPVVMRKSLRLLEKQASSDDPPQKPLEPSPQKPLERLLAPLPFDTCGGGGESSHKQFVETMLGFAMVKDDSSSNVMTESIEFEEGGFDTTGPLSLEPQNVAHVVPARILVVKFMPCENVKLLAAGDRLGNVAFWNLDSEDDDDDDGIYPFQPHTAPVSSLVFHQNSFSKVISSSYDGLIRLMDVEKSVFDLVYSSDDAIFSLSQRPNDEQSLYFSAGRAMLKVWDLRAGKSFFNWV